jgi:hypothetical protein
MDFFLEHNSFQDDFGGYNNFYYGKKNKKMVYISKKPTIDEIFDLVNTYIDDFFDNINIPLKSFEKRNYNFKKTIENNTDTLFHCSAYTTDDDDKIFKNLLKKYLVMIKDNFYVDTHLYNFLEVINKNPKTADNHNFIKLVKKYNYISPYYIAEEYYKILTLNDQTIINNNNIVFEDNKELKKEIKKIKAKMITEKMENIMETVKKIMHNFKLEFEKIFTDFKSSDYTEDLMYENGNRFINSIIMLIAKYVEPLIELNIYGIYAIISEIIQYEVPLNSIYYCDISDKKHVII